MTRKLIALTAVVAFTLAFAPALAGAYQQEPPQAPRAEEPQAPRIMQDDPQAPRGQDIQAPRGPEAKAPLMLAADDKKPKDVKLDREKRPEPTEPPRVEKKERTIEISVPKDWAQPKDDSYKVVPSTPTAKPVK